MTADRRTPTARPRTYGHHVGGKEIHHETSIDRHDPATGRLVARFADGTAADAAHAAEVAADTFRSPAWQALAAPARAELLDRLAGLLSDSHDLLASLDSEEVGKPHRFAAGDLDLGIAHVRHAAAVTRTLTADSFNDLAPDYVAFASRRPVGVVGLIVPWNFPALILLQKLPYALGAGCTVVAKPSEYTSSTALEIARLCDAAGFPPGAVNVVTGTGAVGRGLIEAAPVRFVSFTGSTATGQTVMRVAAESLTRVALELGGKTANVVYDDADLDDAVRGILFGAFANQGESCVASGRALLHEAIADEFEAALLERVAGLQVGLPDAADTDIGSLIHDAHRERVEALLVAGVEAGADIVAGGRRPSRPDLAAGSFLEPTVVRNVGPDSPLATHEVFGPVLALTRFATDDEAIALANGTPYGLAHSVWTRDINRALQTSARLDAGTVWVNTTSDGSPALAFGGVKHSGFGRDGGAEGLREFTEYQTTQFRIGPRPLPF